MKLIARLEKSKIFWSLLVILFLFFLLRLPSFIEPNWYGDEGVYQVIGMALNNGTALYSGIWDNKPPLLYLIYAIFNGDQFGVRVASLIVGLLSVGLFFHLAQIIYKRTRISIITTIIFTLLFATPFIEGNIANAENFILLPIIIAAILVYKITSKQNHILPTMRMLFLAGFLLGLAFLLKIVAVFDLAAFIVFLVIVNLSIDNIKISKKFKFLFYALFSIFLGFILPLIITVVYFFTNNTFPDFMRAVFFGMFGYVGYGNKFIIPHGLLIFKLIVLALFCMFIFYKREKFSKEIIFVVIWVAFSLFNALFSQRPYIHYVLVLVPSFCLLIGLMLNTINKEMKNFLILILIVVVVALSTTFKFYGLKKTALYYQNVLLFISDRKDIDSYRAFFDHKTPRDYQLASFIKKHTKQNDQIFIWGDSPQIYALSKTLPINKYTVAYHIVQSREGFLSTQNDLNKIKPKYVIILSENKAFPFRLTDYVGKYYFDKSVIYERIF